MLVLFVGVIAFVIAYIFSHLVFSVDVTAKRRIFFLVASVCLMYVAVGSLVFTVQ